MAAIVIDTTKCNGCKACQVACKQWNDLPAVSTTFFGGPGYQNPGDLDFNTMTLVKFLTDGSPGADVDGDGNWNFLKFGCMHCVNPNCVSACQSTGNNAALIDKIAGGPGTFNKTGLDTGFVFVDQAVCIGCMSCAIETTVPPGCPFRVPRYDVPAGGQIASHCHGCVDGPNVRMGASYPGGIKDPSSSWLTGPSLEPACATGCPSDAILYFGTRAAAIGYADTRYGDSEVQATYPNVSRYGSTTWVGCSYNTRVILVLQQASSFYGLP